MITKKFVYYDGCVEYWKHLLGDAFISITKERRPGAKAQLSFCVFTDSVFTNKPVAVPEGTLFSFELSANKTHVSKKINEYSNIINEELNVARSELKELTKPESEKLQRQMLTLSNRLTKLEKRLKVIEDDWSDVDC